MKRLFTLIIALLAVLSFTGISFAAGTVVLKTGVPNRAKTSCEQSGNVTMEYDNGSKMEEGDSIQFTLPNGVTLCKSVNYYLKMAEDGSTMLSNDTSDPVSDNASSNTGGLEDYLIVSEEASSTSGSAAIQPNILDGSTYDLGFLVTGSQGAASLYLTMSRRVVTGTSNTGKVYAQVATSPRFNWRFSSVDPNTRLIVRLFDEKSNLDYFYKITTANTTVYSDYRGVISKSDNVMCIDLTNASEYVGLTPYSNVNDDSFKLSFSGDYYVLHVTGTDTFVVTASCKDACPTFWIDPSVDQSGVTTTSFGRMDASQYNSSAATSSPTTTRWSSGPSSNPMCANTTGAYPGNGVIAYRSGLKLDADSKYEITITLLRNGTTASSDIVWFTSESTAGTLGTSGVTSFYSAPAIYRTNQTEAGNCYTSAAGRAAWATGATWTYAGTGKINQIKTNTTGVQAGDAANLHDAFLIDLPGIYYDYTKVVDGDTISMQVRFGKLPCGGSVTGTVCYATAVKKCASTACYTLIYPYAFGAGNASWWAGLVITNLDHVNTSTVTTKVYDAAGKMGSVTYTIPAGNIDVGTISQIMAKSGWTAASDFDSSKDVYVQVTANTKVDGLMFVGDTNVNLMHGYIPRVYNTCFTTVFPSGSGGVVH